MAMLRETARDGQDPIKNPRVNRHTGERILSHIYREEGGIRLMEWRKGEWNSRKWYPDFCSFLSEWKSDPAQP